MIRFLSKRYSNKRKNKQALKISNPILMQDGEANYPAALMNLSTTIPVQRIVSETNGTAPDYGLDSSASTGRHAYVIENGSTKMPSNLISSTIQNHSSDRFHQASLSHTTITAEGIKMVSDGENLNKFEKAASRNDVIPSSESNLHVFHHVRPPRNVIQCRVEMLDGAFYHVQLPVRLKRLKM